MHCQVDLCRRVVHTTLPMLIACSLVCMHPLADLQCGSGLGAKACILGAKHPHDFEAAAVHTSANASLAHQPLGCAHLVSATASSRPSEGRHNRLGLCCNVGVVG